MKHFLSISPTLLLCSLCSYILDLFYSYFSISELSPSSSCTQITTLHSLSFSFISLHWGNHPWGNIWEWFPPIFCSHIFLVSFSVKFIRLAITALKQCFSTSLSVLWKNVFYLTYYGLLCLVLVLTPGPKAWNIVGDQQTWDAYTEEGGKESLRW